MTADKRSHLLPRLRFPEFRDAREWAEVPIATLLTVRNERLAPTDEMPLFSLTIEDGITPKSARYSREFLVADPGNKKYKLVKPKDIVFNPSNLRWGAINYSRLNHSVVVSPIYEVLYVTDSSTTCFDFVARALMRPEQITRFIEKGQGTLVERIAVKIEFFVETTLLIPTHYDEQQKIANCLGSLDDLIAADGRKLEALRQHQQGLVQQLFPRPGESVPRLRFPEFEDAPEWESRELGLMTSKIGSGVTPRGGEKNYRSSGRPFVRSQNVGWGELILDNVVHIDEDTHASCAATEVEEGDVLLNISGASIGRTAVADARIVGGNVNQHVCIIRGLSEQIHPWFLSQYLISKHGQDQIDSCQAGGNRQGLNFGQIRSFLIPQPRDVAEQERIADCLCAADIIRATYAQRIGALKRQKQGLLQQLFPSLEG